MNIFIAGATGVLGRRVVRRLIARGHDVTGLARSTENEELLRSMGARIARADIFDPKAMTHHVAGHDAVLHLATSIPKSPRPRKKDWVMNDLLRTKGTQNLIRAALENRVRVYVQESIVHLYARYDGAKVDESVALGHDLPYTLQSALEMERIIERHVRNDGLPSITLRFGGFYGPGAQNTVSLIEGIRNRSIPMLGKGDAVWNLIHLDDAAAAVVQAVERYETNTGRAYNIVDDRPVTIKELFLTIAEMVGAPSPRSIPSGVAKIVTGKDAVKFMQISLRASNQAAKEGLGWAPHYPTFREGLQQVMKAYHSGEEMDETTTTSPEKEPILA